MLDSLDVPAAPGVLTRGPAVKAVIGTFLIVLFLAATALSGNQALHQTLHRDSNPHLCLVCSLSTGHADTHQLAPLFSSISCGLLMLLCAACTVVLLADAPYSHALERAPPVS